MKVKTKAFGEIEVSEKQKIHFKNGIFGFEDVYDFVLLDTPDNSPFYWLQAEKNINTAFVLINPYQVYPDFKLNLEPIDKEDLNIVDDMEIIVFSIVTIYENPVDITINLLGPIVINKTNHEAKQIINQIENYTTKHPLFKKEEKC
ncbi:MAG: flagellar assembly protein FliW [Spirochaetes bacterium]|nr:flagellar assembly protein FliW [Spirochaetota bacterium]